MLVEKIRTLDVNNFMINSALDAVNSYRSDIERLEKLKETKLEEVEVKQKELESIESELLSVEENIKTLKENKSKLMVKVEEIKKSIK